MVTIQNALVEIKYINEEAVYGKRIELIHQSDHADLITLRVGRKRYTVSIPELVDALNRASRELKVIVS